MTIATLRGDQLAPVTSRIGFLESPLDEVADNLRAWRQEIHGSASRKRLSSGLFDNIRELEPLVGGVRPRELVVATRSPRWTALVDCGVAGSDPTSTIGYLSRTMRVQGVTVTSIPDRPAYDGRTERFGARQLELFGPIPTAFLNYVRTISVVRDGARWRFDANGTTQHFEDVAAYSRRKVADRFTDEMLVAYSAALGLEPFADDFYPGPCELVTNPSVPPPGAFVLTIDGARGRFGIETG